MCMIIGDIQQFMVLSLRSLNYSLLNKEILLTLCQQKHEVIISIEYHISKEHFIYYTSPQSFIMAFSYLFA